MIAIVVGTRSEIIRMSPVVRECMFQDLDFFILNTGQYTTHEMDRIFFSGLELPAPACQLDVGTGSHSEQTARILVGVEKVLLEEPPGLVLVQGDSNTVLGASVATTKLHLPLGHVGAGLRSFDRLMPEEINREIADHLADVLFAPTTPARENLIREGIPDERIRVTGSPNVDAVEQNIAISRRKSRILSELHLKKKQYFLATVHTEENRDNRSRLEGILDGLARVQQESDLPVVMPVHPLTMDRIRSFGLSTGGIDLIGPVGFLEFLQLEANARIVLTDSGGVQEESCILGVPCVTLLENTNRPETIAVGANVLAGTSPDRILQRVTVMSAVERGWQNPFGDGRSGERIVRICLDWIPSLASSP